MMSLYRAEWLKMRKRPATLGIVLITLIVVVLAMGGFTAYALSQGVGSAPYEAALQLLAYPSVLQFTLSILSSLGMLLAVIFIANYVGSEYSRDTWKMILPRKGSRQLFLWMKIALTFTFILVLVAITLIVGQVVGMLGVLLLGGDIAPSTSTSLADIGKACFALVFQMGFYSLLALLAVITTRSTIGGIVIGVVASTVLGIITQLSTWAAKILPNVHIENIMLHVGVNGGRENQAFIDQMFGQSISVWVSVAVVSAYILAFLAGSMWIFTRRDMAGG